MKRKEEILDERHWNTADYKQRIDAKEWKQLLLNGDDQVIYRGKVTPLVAKNRGYGVCEISKATEIPVSGTLKEQEVILWI